ncbi:MAG: glycyl-tRNA synthetase [archaeon GW2011_AR9]|nr:MAG: glycyl-tRNA synthetase [archaeon GW2011_AR9]MBS3120580.1 glycine--tRNA ligase [Candidatus Woesearchaeota archaeon]HIG93662.1 glycine--tRNA ligase [Candidatus Woesearchaeota archaeon]HIH12510.1 glycine--tRNA ligase [Candidatus Woesearchaeota archaeon]
MTHTTSDLAMFCKKKGFIYPSSEIYGGIAGLYDYGHLGTKLKHNFENLWRSYFLGLNDNFFEIEAANIMPENVFRASGHLENFIDPVIKCSKCQFQDRADHFLEKALQKRMEGHTPEELTKLVQSHHLQCPKCKSNFLPVTIMNMMFPLNLGVGSSQKAYLRPETAQSPYVNFKLQHELLRKKLPLGLAIIGRAYRNEISPRNLTLRQREFTQAELQIFFNPSRINEHRSFPLIKDYPLRTLLVADRSPGKVVERTAAELVQQGLPAFYVYHLVKIQQFYLERLHIPTEKFRLYQLNDTEKAFYNKYHFDLEVDLQEYGFTEVGGLHYRTDHDLQGHGKISKQSLEVLEEESGQKFIPHVLELSFGVDRNVYALLDLAYEDNQQRGNIVLHLPNQLTPFYCAVFPLVKNKPEITAKAEQVYEQLRKTFSCFYDESGSVGRRYARADEIGTRYCLTIDFESLDDNAVTVRDRENTFQERVNIARLIEKLSSLQHQ